MQSVHDTLGKAFGFFRQFKPNPDQVTLSISAMIAARFNSLHALHKAARLRYRRKLAGDRRKVPPLHTAANARRAAHGSARDRRQMTGQRQTRPPHLDWAARKPCPRIMSRRADASPAAGEINE